MERLAGQKIAERGAVVEKLGGAQSAKGKSNKIRSADLQ